MSVNYFDSITQYSKDLEAIVQDENLKGKNFCPFFSLITALNFLKGSEPTKECHENSVIQSVLTHSLYNVGNQMYFNDLISLTDINPNEIIATSVELIRENVVGYSEIFPETMENGRYAEIFLKNGKFFVVLVNNGKYSIRDCHESKQFNDLTREAIIHFLNEVYQFNHEIDIDGYKIEEYSNIEYVRIKSPFKMNIEFAMYNGTNSTDTVEDTIPIVDDCTETHSNIVIDDTYEYINKSDSNKFEYVEFE